MLKDPREIEIIAKARQPNVRKESRSRQPFFRILADFFENVRLDGSYIDLGPGHYDFGELAREKGGITVGLDNDPAVVELGRYKGFETIEASIQSLADAPLGRTFDGVFNKFAFNAFWSHRDPARHRALVEALAAMVAPEGWAWIAPWNGVPKNAALEADECTRTLELQRRFFEEASFSTHLLSATQAKHYGIGGNVANNVVFLRNLTWKASVT